MGSKFPRRAWVPQVPRFWGPGRPQTSTGGKAGHDKRPAPRIRHRGRATACQAPLPVVFSQPFSLHPLTPNGYFAGIFSRFAIMDLSIPKRRPRPPGFAGMTTPAAPSEACRSQNRMLNQFHDFSGCAATKPCISGIVRHKFRQIGYLPRPSWPKPLKINNLTKTTPGGSGGSKVVQT